MRNCIISYSRCGFSESASRSIAPLVPVNYAGDRLALDLDEIVLRPSNRDHHAEFYLLGNSQQIAELAFHKHLEGREGCAQTERASRYYQVLRRRVERRPHKLLHRRVGRISYRTADEDDGRNLIQGLRQMHGAGDHSTSDPAGR